MRLSKWFIIIPILMLLIAALVLWVNIFNNHPEDVIKQYLNVVSSYLSDIDTRKSNAVGFGYDETYVKSYIEASVIDMLEDLKALVADYNKLKPSLKEFFTEYVGYSDQASDLTNEILNYSYISFNKIYYLLINDPHSKNPLSKLELDYIYYNFVVTSEDMTVVDKIGNNSWYFNLEPVKKAVEENYMAFLLLPEKYTQIPLKGFKKPRFYYLKKTLFGWKIDWLKSMEDLVNN
jgi:hypothetical protein